MKYTEKKILEIAKKVISDLNPEALKHDTIENAFFNNEKDLSRDKKKIIIHPCWTVSINTLFDNTDFLTISDETGEPIYYQNFNMITAEIEKNSKGKYVIK